MHTYRLKDLEKNDYIGNFDSIGQINKGDYIEYGKNIFSVVLKLHKQIEPPTLVIEKVKSNDKVQKSKVG